MTDSKSLLVTYLNKPFIMTFIFKYWTGLKLTSKSKSVDKKCTFKFFATDFFM